MSAIPLRADIRAARRHVRSPLADIDSLFDHLAGASEKCWRDGQTERFGRLETYDQIKPGRLLDGDFSRFGPSENLVDQLGSPMK